MAKQDLRGQILYNAGLITKDQLDSALEEQKVSGEKIGQCLLRLGYVQEDKMMMALETQVGIPWIRIKEDTVSPDVVNLVPDVVVFNYQVMPIKFEDGILKMATCDPLTYENIDDIRLVTEFEIELVLITDSDFNILVEQYYGKNPENVDGLEDSEELGAVIEGVIDDAESLVEQAKKLKEAENAGELGKTGDAEGAIGDDKSLVEEAKRLKGLEKKMAEDFGEKEKVKDEKSGENISGSVVIEDVKDVIKEDFASKPKDIFENILKEAFTDGASNIHIEFLDNGIRIFYRINGELCDVTTENIVDKSKELLSKIKVVFGWEQGKKFSFPMQQFINIKIMDDSVGFLVSVIPVLLGTNIDIKIKRPLKKYDDFESLGMFKDEIKKIGSLDYLSNGMFLISGPEVSGKSTLFYTLLSDVMENQKVSLVNDFFENKVDGVCQISPDSDSLNYILDGDFDLLAFDEMDDEKKINLQMQACLKGKACLGTFYGHDSIDVLMRIKSFNLDSDLLFSYVKGVVCQKFVRLICENCKQVDRRKFKEHLIKNQVVETFYKGAGCEDCEQTGFNGKIPVFEILIMTDKLRDLIHNNASCLEIKKEAEKQKMITFRHSGVSRIKKKLTTYDEVEKL